MPGSSYSESSDSVYTEYLQDDTDDNEHYHEDENERQGPSSTTVRNGSVAPRAPKHGKFYGVSSRHREQQQSERPRLPKRPPRDQSGQDWEPERQRQQSRSTSRERRRSSSRTHYVRSPSPLRPTWLQNLGRANTYISEMREETTRPVNYWDQTDYDRPEQRNRSLVAVRPFSGSRRRPTHEEPMTHQSRKEPRPHHPHGEASKFQSRTNPPVQQSRREPRQDQSRRFRHIPDLRPSRDDYVPYTQEWLSSTVSQISEYSETDSEDQVSQQSDRDVYERPVDLVHDPSQSTKNMTVRLEFDIEEDWDSDLEEFCRLRRLGRFRDAEEYFRRNLERYGTIPYIRVQYAEMLVSSGNFKLFRDLRLLPEFLPPVGEESTDELNRGKLAANYALLDLLSQRHFPDYIQMAWRIVENTLRALSSEKVIGSTEIQLLSLCLRVLRRLEACTHEGILDVPKIFAKHLFDWSHLYREIAAEDCIWDARDLLVAATSVFGWQDTSTMFFGTGYLPKIMDLISNDWIRSDYDEPSALGLLDLFTSLILQDHGKEMDVRNHLLLEYATLLARSIQDHDEDLMRSRPFLQWLLAKTVLEMAAAPERPDGIRLKDYDGLELKQKNGIHLPVYIPKNRSERPSWDMFFTRSSPTQRHAAEVVVATAEAIGDYSLKGEALKVLILLSQNPGRSMADLCHLQLDVQGDTEGYLATRLSSYLLLNESNEITDLGTSPTDFDPTRNETCENATLRWASAVLPAQTLLQPSVGEDNQQPTSQNANLSSELLKTAFNACGPKLPSYIIDFARQKLQLDAPSAVPMPMLALHNPTDDRPGADNPGDDVGNMPRYNPFISGQQQAAGYPYPMYPNPNYPVHNNPFLNHQDFGQQPPSNPYQSYPYSNYPTAYGQSQNPYAMYQNVTPYAGTSPWVQGPGPSNIPGAPNPFDFYTPSPPPPPPPAPGMPSKGEDQMNQPPMVRDGVWPNVQVAGWPPTWQEDAQHLANPRPPPSTGDDGEVPINVKEDTSASQTRSDKVSQWLFPGTTGGLKIDKNEPNRQSIPPPSGKPTVPVTTAQVKNSTPVNDGLAPETKENKSGKEPKPATPEVNTTDASGDASNMNGGSPGPNTGIRRRHTVDVLPERSHVKPNNTTGTTNGVIPEEINTSSSQEPEGNDTSQRNNANEKPSFDVEKGLPAFSFPPELLKGHKLTVILNSKDDPQKVKAYVIDGEGVHETPVVRPAAGGDQHRSRTKIHVKSGSYEVADAESQSGESTVKVNRSRSKEKGKARDTSQAPPSYPEGGVKEQTTIHGTVRPHVVLDVFHTQPPHDKLPKPARKNSGLGGPAGEGPSRRQSMSRSRLSKEEQDELPKSASKRAKKAAQRFSSLGPVPSLPPSPPPLRFSRPSPDEPLYTPDANPDTGVISENDEGAGNLGNDGGEGEQDAAQDLAQNQGQGHDQIPAQKQDHTQEKDQTRHQKERQYYNQDPDQQKNEQLGEGIRVYSLYNPTDTTASATTNSSEQPAPSPRKTPHLDSAHEQDKSDEDWEIQSVDGDEATGGDGGQSHEAVFETLSEEDEDEEATRKEVEQMLNDMQNARRRRQEADRAEEEWLKGRLERLAAKEKKKKEEEEEEGRGKGKEKMAVVEEPESISSVMTGDEEEERGGDKEPKSPLKKLKRKGRGIKRLADFVKGASG
ncbi:hypothetical protein QBC41DRAFT_386669 [Cercophora samala]|uniref:Uncharacterized protein n=1 Tax=Cercophora samala TaxID=330535 RepID=A0AA40DC82_9PEZI|nr:hypothetical protein QBC41DRAFT_386669 [Cercophora samala]